MNVEVTAQTLSEPPAHGPGSRRRRFLFFAVWGAFLILVLLLFRGVLLPFFLAIVVAYVLAPLVSGLERVRFGRTRMPRWIAVVLLYVVLLSLLSVFTTLGVPRLAAEIEKLARDAPRAIEVVRKDWLPTLERELREAMAPYKEIGRAAGSMGSTTVDPDGAPDGGVPDSVSAIRVIPVNDGTGGLEVRLPREGFVVEKDGDVYRVATTRSKRRERGDLTATLTDAFSRAAAHSEQHAVTLFKTAQAVVRAFVKGIFTFSIMLMLSAYLLLTSDRIFAFFRSLVRPSHREDFNQLLARIDRGLSGVVRGQLLICLVNGVLSGIGFYMAGLAYWPILTLIATVLSIIPIFGAFLSSIPAVIIGLQDSFGKGVFVLLWIIGIHQIEANLLNPKIMGDAAKVHPVLVVFALLAGEHLFGIAGALLAVPVLSVVQSLFLHFREVALGVPKGEPTTDAPARYSG